jgi:Yip1-like protein
MIAIFLRRVVGAAMLNANTYEEVEADRSATLEALLVVILASVAAGIGARGAFGPIPTLRFFLVATALSIAGWAMFAVLTFEIGSRLLATRDTHTDIGELLRTLGFAAAPGLVQIFAMFGGPVPWIFAFAILWSLVASVVAVRQALDFDSTARAFAVCGLAWLLSLGMVALFGSVVAALTGQLS